MKASEETLRTLMEQGSQRSRLDSMQTRAELYDLISYESWESKDASYFGRPPG
jgi:2-methylisocitrate lyase-like PEP mutase family enzyme